MIKSRFNTLVMKKEVDECDKDLFLDITLKTPLFDLRVCNFKKSRWGFFETLFEPKP